MTDKHSDDVVRPAEDMVASDPTVIALDDEAYDAFIAALEAPSEPVAGLRELFARRPPWDR